MLGFPFVLSQAAKWVGYRVYQEDGEIRASYAQLWSLDGTTLLGQGMPPARSVNKVQAGSGWHSYYIRPQVLLEPSVEYAFQVAMDGGNTRTTFNGMATSITNGIITALGQDVGLGGVFIDGQLTVQTGATANSNNLYGVDVILWPVT